MSYENLDRKLVNGLLDDGRASFRSLAETLDVSVTTVSNHLGDLEDSGIVEEFRPVVDYGSFGYDVTAVVQVKVDGDALPPVIERLRDCDEVVSVYEVTGHHDVVAVGKFRDTEAVNDRLADLLADPGVQRTNTSVVLDAAAEHDQFALDVE